MTETVSKGKNVRARYYMHCVIMLALYIIIGRLPVFGGVTTLGMQVLGIFVAAAYGWCTLGLLWPSLCILIALGLTDYCSVEEAFITGFGDKVVLSVVAIFAFAAYLEESGLSQFIANWFVSRKIGEGRPWVFTLLLFAAAYVLSSLVSLYATVVILWSIFYKVCEAVGVKRQSKYATMVICGITITSCLTTTIFPFKPFTQVFYGITMKSVEMSLTIDFIPWFLFNLVVSLVMILLYLLAAKYILRPDVHLVKEAGAKYAPLRHAKMNRDQKIAAFFLTAFIISQVLPSFMPKTWPATALLNNLSLLGCAVIAMIALSIMRSREGTPVIEIGHLISKGVNWDIVIMLAATMPLSAAIESKDTGLIATVVGLMQKMLGNVNGTFFLVLVVALFLLATQFAHNLVLAIVLMPVIAKLGLDYGIHPFAIINLIWFAAQSAFLLPASSSPAAMIYGNDHWVSNRYAYLYNAAFIIVALIVPVCIGVPLSQVIFPALQ